MHVSRTSCPREKKQKRTKKNSAEKLQSDSKRLIRRSCHFCGKNRKSIESNLILTLLYDDNYVFPPRSVYNSFLLTQPVSNTVRCPTTSPTPTLSTLSGLVNKKPFEYKCPPLKAKNNNMEWLTEWFRLVIYDAGAPCLLHSTFKIQSPLTCKIQIALPPKLAGKTRRFRGV